jgi:hypothetical protein
MPAEDGSVFILLPVQRVRIVPHRTKTFFVKVERENKMSKITRRNFLKVSGVAAAAAALTACGGSSSTASSAASGEDLPDSTTRADTSGLNPGDFDENSIFSITGTAAAFEPCLGWGPGVSGCSLKSVIAAASLLQWAENARLASRTPEAVQEAFYSWYDTLDADEQESFAEAWTMIEPDALSLLSDKDSMAGRIEDAGLDPDTLPGCTLKNWQALQTVLDDCVPAAGQ